MGKPYWLWGLVPVSVIGGVVLLNPRPLADPQPAVKVQSRDGVYVLAQEHFGPLKAVVLVADGDWGTWYRFAHADGTDRATAKLILGQPMKAALVWEHGSPNGRGITGMAIYCREDGTGRLQVKIQALGNQGDFKQKRSAPSYEEFVLRKTRLASPPDTVAELIAQSGEPQVIP